MHWIAPSEKDTVSGTLEKRLWAAADQSRANSGLKSQEYSVAVHSLKGDIRHGSNVNNCYHGLHNQVSSGYSSDH